MPALFDTPLPTLPAHVFHILPNFPLCPMVDELYVAPFKFSLLRRPSFDLHPASNSSALHLHFPLRQQHQHSTAFIFLQA